MSAGTALQPVPGATRERRYWDEIGSALVHQEQPLWRVASDRANAALLRRWLEESAICTKRVLKTDAFDEAMTGGFLGPYDGAELFGIDLSTVVAAAAAKRCTLRILAADVRRLPFADASFDIVISPSTLDHFSDPLALGHSIQELRRVLKIGGSLVVSLDNPWHPSVALRAKVRRLLGRAGPYFTGATLSATALRNTLVEAGFDVAATGAVQHFPRLLLSAVERLANRSERMREAILAAAGACERLDRLPSRYLTGQFVAVHCLRRV